MNGTSVALAVVVILVALLVAAFFFPRPLVRAFFRVLLTCLYRRRVVGLEHLPRESGCVVICNHVSWIDGILILWMLPRNVRFVVDGQNFHSRILKWLAGVFDTILMMPGPKPIARALKSAREAAAGGDVVGLFPEGTLTRTGQLQAFRPGLQHILKGSDVPVVPLWLDGIWGSIFSFSGGKFFFKRPRQLRRTLTLYVGQPLPASAPIHQHRQQVAELGARATIDNRHQLPVLPRRIVRAWRAAGRQLKAADSSGTEVSGRQLLIRTLALRRMLRREVLGDDEQCVGVLLPPSVAAVAVNVALSIDRRVTANLNYTVSNQVLNHCIGDVGIRHVLSSEKFLSKFEFEIDADVVLLESLKDKVTTLDKLIAFVQATLVPVRLLDRLLGTDRIGPDDLLTVIFTSGSTGMPKGVLLSQANVSHNVEAIERAVKLDSHDVVIGVLPFFHSFGYAVTLWAVSSLGPCGIYHYNPLDARQIGKLAERYRATLLLGTPTFLRSYLRRIEPSQFASLDCVVVGAEKLPIDLADSFEKRFGVRPVEGYGTTELSPLVSVNIPPSRSAAKYQVDRVEGSVGRPLFGVAARIVSPETGAGAASDEDGLLWVTGPNVMRGYANLEDQTREKIQDGWYNTGDIAHLDAGGFLHITGRLSRFSKIAGEMVPHVRVEEELSKLLSEGAEDEQLRVCVTAVPDPKKGERLVVLYTSTERSPDELRAGLREAGLPNLFVPAAENFLQVEQIPVLGTGKLDLRRAREMAAEGVGVSS